jgi:hypothetical protein
LQTPSPLKSNSAGTPPQKQVVPGIVDVVVVVEVEVGTVEVVVVVREVDVV